MALTLSPREALRLRFVLIMFISIQKIPSSIPKGSTATQVGSHYIIDLKATSFTQATIDVIEKQLPAVLKLKKEGQC